MAVLCAVVGRYLYAVAVPTPLRHTDADENGDICEKMKIIDLIKEF